MKNKLFIFLIISVLFLFATMYYSESAYSFSGTSSSYTVDSKSDVVTATNVTSTSFTQRFIGGIQAVARYVSNLFSGRFGVLEEATSATTTTIIYACGDLNSANTVYILNNSVNSSGTCFNVLANSISLNCNSSIVNYSQSANGYAILNKGYNHTNIQNCNITQGSNTRTNSYAVYFLNGTNSTITNNNIITYGPTSSNANNHNVFLVGYKNNTLSSNSLVTKGRSSHNVYLSNSANNTIYSNNVSTFGTTSYGAYLVGAGSLSNNLSANNLTIYGSTTTGGGGIVLSTNALYNLIIGNNITVKGASSYGIYLLSGSRYNNISWNNFNLLNSSSVAIRLHSASSNNSFIGNNITATATGSLGFDLTSNTDENKLINNSVRSSSYALRIISGNANSIYNNIFNSTTNNLVSMSSTPNFINKLNTTKTAAINILGGNNIGGNYWARSSGTGFSQTCQDVNLDGICDSVYSINAYNKDYLPLTILDTSAPIVNLFSPANASFINGIVTLRANASDSSGIINVTFQYSNSSVGYTTLCVDTSSPYTCNWNTATFSDASEGYIIKAIAYDGQNNNANDVKQYSIDRTRPIIYDMVVTYPSGQESVKSGGNITLSAIVTDSPIISAGISYVQANLTNLNSTGFSNMTFSSGSKAPLQNSTWTLNVTVTVGTTGSTTSEISVFDASNPNNNRRGDLWQVTMDNTAPTYSGLSSSNQIYNNTVASFVVSSADTIALDHYIFSQNSSGDWINDSFVSINGTSYYIEHTKIVYTGNFSYRFYIYDDAGNSVQTDTGNIEVIGSAPIPVIYFVSPADGLVSNNASVNFTYYYTNAAVDNCTLNLNGAVNETIINPANDTILGFSKNLADNDYFWFVSCMRNEQDGDNNITAEYFSGTRSLNIDTIAPLISIISPENITYNSSSLNFNVTVNDDADWCGYDLDSAGNITMNTLNATYFYYLYSEIAAGSHNIIFSCNDTANNYNVTQIRYFSVNFPDLIVNITYPVNLQEIVRGNDAVAGEDDMGLVPNSINITARVYNNETNDGIVGVTCHFYDNTTFLGDAYTNSSGQCTMNYTKSSKNIGNNPISVNYTLLSDITKITNVSQVNISIIRYVAPVAMTNLRSFGGYFDGDVSVLRINITKVNETGTYFYDPQNISANATNAAQQPYSGGASYYPNGSTKNITYISQGQFSANQTVSTSFGSFIRWEVTVSDNNYASYLGSAVHADKSVCTPSYSDWSAWSACSGGTQTRSRTDGCGGTEVATQSCGGGGTSCFPAGTKILMSDNSYKNIEEVKVGDYVISYDEITKENNIGKVLELESPMRDHMCQIIFSDNSILNLTREHPVYTKEGWKAINPEETKKENSLLNTGKLKEGDLVFFSDLNYKQLKSISCWNETIQTYNLKSIDKFRNFYADKVLVHNKGEGGGCTGTGWSEWSEWSACTISDTYPNGYSSRTRTDSTGCVETEQDTSCACTPNWQCGLFGSCTDGMHERTCNDLAQCDANNLTYTDSESCIIGLNVDYNPPELFLNILAGQNINFNVTATLTGVAILEVKWYLDSAFQSGDSGTTSVESHFSKSFNNNSQIKAIITSGNQSEEVTWQVNILPTAKLNCVEDWYCKWKPCDISGYKYAITCQDLNLCGTNFNKPYKQACSCIPTFNCSDWSECQPDYNIQNILRGEVTINGSQQRTCIDSKQCENATLEIRECPLEIHIKAVKAEYCYEKYIEIYEINPTRLVSRVKESSFEQIKRIDIGFLVTEFGGYCSYCYDKVKNFDEEEIDCGGKYCAPCVVKGKFFDWLYYVKLGLWIILLLMIVYFIYKNKQRVMGSVYRRIKLIRRVGKIRKPAIVKEAEYIEKPRLKKPRLRIREHISGMLSKVKLPAVEIKIRVGGAISKARARRAERRKIRRIRRVVRKEARGIKRKIRRKEISVKEIPGIEKQLKEWKQKGYYDTSKIQRRLDEFKGRNPLK